MILTQTIDACLPDERLMQVCPDWLKPMVIVGVFTGFRRSNVVKLKWSEVDLENRLFHLEKTKNGEPLTVPMAQPAYDILVTRQTGKVFYINCPYVFHENGKLYKLNRVSVAFRRAIKRAGIEDFRLHDLRHDFGSKVSQKQIDEYRIQLLLGQKSSRMAQRYTHLRVENLREAISKTFDEGGTKGGTEVINENAIVVINL